MILEKFYKTYLEGKEEINYFLDSILELVLVDEIKDRKTNNKKNSRTRSINSTKSKISSNRANDIYDSTSMETAFSCY